MQLPSRKSPCTTVAPICSGMWRLERDRHRLHRLELARLRALPLLAPALDLARDVGLLLAEVAEPDRVGIDGVEVGEHLDQRLGDRAALGGGEVALGVGGLDQDVAVDEAHHVEGRAVDRLVGAEAERRRHRHAGGAERRDDLELAAHVVRGREHRAERRTAQHIALAARVGDLEGDVGVAGGNEIESEAAGAIRRRAPRSTR